MNRTTFGAGTEETTFHHNGDYSGSVQISRRYPSTSDCENADVPMSHLERLVANKKQAEIIRALEGLDFEWPDDIHRVEVLYVFLKEQGMV